MAGKIRRFPDPVLTKPTEPVKEVDGEVRKLIKTLFETMYEAEGVGLAANQIGEPISLLVIDTTPKEEEPPVKMALVNPELVEAEGKLKTKEGCLSFPGLSVEVVRAKKVKVRALNEEGEPVEVVLEGFPAVVFQHEFDHLQGVTFLDRLPPWRRRMALEKYKKLLREME